MMPPLRSVVRTVKRMDHSMGRRVAGPRVLVDVRTRMNLGVLRPVWQRLLDDRRVTVHFAGEPGTDVGPALEEERLEHLLVPRKGATWMRFDLALSADLWNPTPLRRCRRQINFFHGVAGKYDLDHPSRLEAAGLQRFDRIAFINEDRLRRYVESGVIRRDQAVLVGFPKLDDLVNGRWSAAAVRASLGLEPSLETVLYAPTFSTANSLHLAGEPIIAALLDSTRNVIVKLHDRSMTPHPTYTDGIDWRARLSSFARHPRFALADCGDAGPFLAAADLLVTDHSTVGFELALLDRPIVVYDAPRLREAARIDEDKWALLRSMAHVVTTPDELRRAVDSELSDPGRHHDARQRAHQLFSHAGRATPRALAVVYELLELAPPAAAVDWQSSIVRAG